VVFFRNFNDMQILSVGLSPKSTQKWSSSMDGSGLAALLSGKLKALKRWGEKSFIAKTGRWGYRIDDGSDDGEDVRQLPNHSFAFSIKGSIS
jgi:hypothetical protein